MMNLSKIMFFNILALGTLMTVSSLSWIISWIGLEVNLLSIMPLLKTYNNKYYSESVIKYFIVQTMASLMFLFSVLFFICSKNYSIELTIVSSLLLNMTLLLKMGAAPFHFWMPEVLSGLSWELIFIVITWQKIAPMIILMHTTYTPTFLSFVIILSSLFSGLQGINQTCLRKIMTYSSINHVSWMISAILNSATTWLYYFLTYCVINYNIIMILLKYNIYNMKQLSKLFSSNKKIKFFFMLNFLSLGGLPPFLGFFPKWMTVSSMINNNYYILVILLIIFTLISLYIYTRITFSSFSINSEESLIKIFNKINYFHFTINLFSLIGLTVCNIVVNYF
uniref:NADH-ubiquinone oxidoreductase chain 2 n=1 Tax=Curculio davidi TaxID=1453177 RepID=A0A1S7C7S4_9CUCU|nr:NADH dehydrogenase subunit 2 [Curculio davidi]AQX92147.1 NADH dehydrogenase subunit 2 [Curculio davidi]